MGNTNKTSALLLTLIITMSCLALLAAKPINAQTIPKPSIPVFTLKSENTSFALTVTNQQFTPYERDDLGGRVNLIYNVRAKQHNATYWTELYNNYDDYPISSYSQYTILPLPTYTPIANSVDFQVQAMIGIIHRQPTGAWVFNGTTSDWSDTQTITLESQVSPSPNPTVTSTPIQTVTNTPNTPISGNQQVINEALTVAVTVLAVAVVSLLVYVRRIKGRIDRLSKQ